MTVQPHEPVQPADESPAERPGVTRDRPGATRDRPGAVRTQGETAVDDAIGSGDNVH